MTDRFDEEIRAEIAANDRALIDGVNVQLGASRSSGRSSRIGASAARIPVASGSCSRRSPRRTTVHFSDDGLAEFVTGLLALTRREIEKGGGASQAPPR